MGNSQTIGDMQCLKLLSVAYSLLNFNSFSGIHLLNVFCLNVGYAIGKRECSCSFTGQRVDSIQSASPVYPPVNTPCCGLAGTVQQLSLIHFGFSQLDSGLCKNIFFSSLLFFFSSIHTERTTSGP